MPERDEQVPDGTADAVARIDPSERPSTAILEAVGAISDRDPRGAPARRSDGPEDGLPPLSEAIDPDALNAFVRSIARRDGQCGRVTFEYAGYDVTVTGDGRVAVSEVAESSAAGRIDDR